MFFKEILRVAPDGSGSCIDNAFIKSNLNIKAYKISYYLTDHYLLLLDLKLENLNPKVTYRFINESFCNIVKLLTGKCSITY